MMENEMEERLIELEGEKENGLLRRTWEENMLIWKTAFPAVLFRLSMFGVYVITQSFIGHISNVDLAGFALVQAILVRFTNGIQIGMSSATQTLCGQAFGAKHYHMMGVYLQRSWIVNFVVVTLIVPLFVFSSPLFKLLGQEDEVADATEQISIWFIGIIYSLVFTLTIEMFLQSQRKNMFIGVTSPLCFFLHLLISWIFVSKLNWGLPGAMGALVLSRWAFLALLSSYTFGGWCSDSWTGLSIESLRDIIPMVKLSISSGVMICVQLWYTSVLVLIAGYTSNATVNISAFYISININAWQYMFCLGLMGGTCARVANELGRGNAKAAKFAIKISLAISMTFGVIMSVICVVFGHQIPYFFTSDDEVATVAGDFSVPLGITILLNSFESILTGVAVGTGSQAKVAWINVASYYLVGIPIGCILDFVVGYGIMGIWIGLISGQIVQAIILAYLIWRIDWISEMENAANRLNRFYLDRSQEETQTQ